MTSEQWRVVVCSTECAHWARAISCKVFHAGNLFLPSCYSLIPSHVLLSFWFGFHVFQSEGEGCTSVPAVPRQANWWLRKSVPKCVAKPSDGITKMIANRDWPTIKQTKTLYLYHRNNNSCNNSHGRRWRQMSGVCSCLHYRQWLMRMWCILCEVRGESLFLSESPDERQLAMHFILNCTHLCYKQARYTNTCFEGFVSADTNDFMITHLLERRGSNI